MRPPANAAALRAELRIEAVEDKGEGRGAIVYAARDLIDATSGEAVAELRSAEFLRDDGGDGGIWAASAVEAAA